MQAYDSDMGYKVEFTFDFGRGVPEACRYYPEVKELHVATKGGDNAGKLIKMNPDLMGNNPTDDMRFIWDVTRQHRGWLDADHEGEELDPKDAPPGILDSDIAVPLGMESSIEGQRTREVGVPRDPDAEDSNPTPEIDQFADDPFEQPEGQPQGSPPVQERPVQEQQPAPSIPMIQIPLDTYMDMKTDIEMLMLLCETQSVILKRTVEPDSVDMAIVGLHQDKIKQFGEKRDGSED